MAHSGARESQHGLGVELRLQGSPAARGAPPPHALLTRMSTVPARAARSIIACNMRTAHNMGPRHEHAVDTKLRCSASATSSPPRAPLISATTRHTLATKHHRTKPMPSPAPVMMAAEILQPPAHGTPPGRCVGGIGSQKHDATASCSGTCRATVVLRQPAGGSGSRLRQHGRCARAPTQRVVSALVGASW